MTMLPGLDASSVQGALPMAALSKAGFRFLVHKCRQGNDGKDPWFERNVSAARDAGLYVGAYHFLYPLPHLDPRAQAEGFFAASTLGAARGELPPALDLEWPDPDAGWAKWKCTPEQIAEFARVCLERMTELYGRRPLVYTYPYFMRRLHAAGSLEWLADYPLWSASYGAKPTLPEPWTDWVMWQHDGNGGLRLPNGLDCDFDRFNGDEAALAAFAGVQPPRPVDRAEGPAAVDVLPKPAA